MNLGGPALPLALLLVAAMSAAASADGPAAGEGFPRPPQEAPMPQPSTLLIDDVSRLDRLSALGTYWRGFTDQVMGGVSTATIRVEAVAGRQAIRLTGEVSLENNGGFVQVALPLTGSGLPLDISSYKGLRLLVLGNGETYHIHLRTTATGLPWQYYYAAFPARPTWQTIDLPFDAFQGASLKAKLDLGQATRIAIVAYGKAFRADVAVSRIELYR